jgi:hypothetical protein
MIFLHPLVEGVMHKQIRKQGADYTSYNVAKLMIEFSTNIPRERLRPGYGDGFYGAPLDTVEPSHIPSARDQGGHHRGKSRAKKGSSSGGPHRV